MIKYVQGDLFTTKADIIAHGCNCRGGFGSGVAGQIASRYSKAKHYYLDKFDEDGWYLGDIQPVLQSDGKYIVNCGTQFTYLPRGIRHADYDGIRLSMERLLKFAKDKGLSVAIPKIGAGLAGGDWTVIEKILKEIFTNYDITIYYL